MTDHDTTELDRLLTDTRSPDLLIRLQAIEALGKTDDTRAVEPLIALLADPEWLVCITSVRALGELGNPRAAAPIVNVVDRDDRLGFSRAIEASQVIPDALRRLGEPGFQALLHVLSDHVNEEFMGGAAVSALDELHDRRAIDALVLALNSPVFEVSAAASQALSHFGEEAVPLFVTALESPNYYTRFHAGLALYQFDTAPLPLLLDLLRKSDQTETRVETINVLASIDDDSVDEALRTVLDDLDTAVRNAAVGALGARGDASLIDQLLDLPQSPVAGSDWVVESIAKFGPNAIPDLLRSLQDASRPAVARRRATESLGKLVAAEAVPALIAALHDSDERVQGAAAEALGEVHDERAISPLLTLLTSGPEIVRRAAISALARFDQPEVFDTLVRIATDPTEDHGTRFSAITTLNFQYKERALPVLRDLALGEDDWAATHAISMLGFQGEAGISITIEAARVGDALRRLRTLNWLRMKLERRQDSRIVAYLRELLDDPEPALRFSSANVLSRMGDIRAVDALIEDVNGHRPGRGIQAVDLLAKLGDSRALPTLERALEKLDVALNEARTASDNGDMAQRQRTIRLYEERDELLRAILSLRRAGNEQELTDESEER